MLITTCLGLLLSQIVTATNNFNDQCDSLVQQQNIGNVSLWFTATVPAGTNLTFPENDPSCARQSQIVTVDICRVALYVSTSDQSGISMEAWLPRNWTGRFLTTGNGGLGGCIQYEDLAYGAELGFATVGANNGHNGTSGKAFHNSPQVVEDFAYRSIHTSAVVGKQLSAAFYGKQHNKSYYLGCSTGGRQGFKSAQSFPEDFDGIVAGAPAIDFNNLNSWSSHFFPLTGPPSSPSFISGELWAAVHEDVLDQCDGLDGYVDGIIEDPLLCDYRPESLLCGGDTANITSCLTASQVATVRAIFSPLHGLNDTFVYPRMQPGSELVGAIPAYYSGAESAFSDWYRYAIYNDPGWDGAIIGPVDYANAAKKDPYNISTWVGDLSAVRDRGAKILHYHGQQDPIISSDNSPRYYDYVARTMALSTASLDQFYRLFRISGMGHCGGGPGATFIGNKAASAASLSPDGNVIMAMVRWVEEGVAPDTILGTAFVDSKLGGEVAFQRKHCRYPFRNMYDGHGDAKSPDSWKCVL